jgi:hypothetical protein
MSRRFQGGSLTVDSLLGIAASTAAAVMITMVPPPDPAQFNNASQVEAYLLEARSAAHLTGVAELTLATSGSGLKMQLYQAGHTGATDSVTSVPIGVTATKQLDAAFTLTANGTTVAPPITIRMAKDGAVQVNGAACNTLTFTFTAETVADSFTFPCHG